MHPRRCPEAYADGSWSFDTVKARPLIDLLLRLGGWTRGQHVVEVGAGLGHFSEQLRRRGLAVTALETDGDTCARARRIYPRLQVLSLAARSFAPTDPVDHVFIRDPALAERDEDLAAAFSWLRPGGSVVVQLAGTVDDPRHALVRAQLEDLGAVQTQTDWSGAKLRPGRAADRGIVLVARLSEGRIRAGALLAAGLAAQRRVRTG